MTRHLSRAFPCPANRCWGCAPADPTVSKLQPPASVLAVATSLSSQLVVTETTGGGTRCLSTPGQRGRCPSTYAERARGLRLELVSTHCPKSQGLVRTVTDSKPEESATRDQEKG